MGDARRPFDLPATGAELSIQCLTRYTAVGGFRVLPSTLRLDQYDKWDRVLLADHTADALYTFDEDKLCATETLELKQCGRLLVQLLGEDTGQDDCDVSRVHVLLRLWIRCANALVRIGFTQLDARAFYLGLAAVRDGISGDFDPQSKFTTQPGVSPDVIPRPEDRAAVSLYREEQVIAPLVTALYTMQAVLVCCADPARPANLEYTFGAAAALRESHARPTYQDLVGAGSLPAEFARRVVENIRVDWQNSWESVCPPDWTQMDIAYLLYEAPMVCSHSDAEDGESADSDSGSQSPQTPLALFRDKMVAVIDATADALEARLSTVQADNTRWLKQHGPGEPSVRLCGVSEWLRTWSTQDGVFVSEKRTLTPHAYAVLADIDPKTLLLVGSAGALAGQCVTPGDELFVSLIAPDASTSTNDAQRGSIFQQCIDNCLADMRVWVRCCIALHNLGYIHLDCALFFLGLGAVADLRTRRAAAPAYVKAHLELRLSILATRLQIVLALCLARRPPFQAIRFEDPTPGYTWESYDEADDTNESEEGPPDKEAEEDLDVCTDKIFAEIQAYPQADTPSTDYLAQLQALGSWVWTVALTSVAYPEGAKAIRDGAYPWSVSRVAECISAQLQLSVPKAAPPRLPRNRPIFTELAAIGLTPDLTPAAPPAAVPVAVVAAVPAAAVVAVPVAVVAAAAAPDPCLREVEAELAAIGLTLGLEPTAPRRDALRPSMDTGADEPAPADLSGALALSAASDGDGGLETVAVETGGAGEDAFAEFEVLTQTSSVQLGEEPGSEEQPPEHDVIPQSPVHSGAPPSDLAQFPHALGGVSPIAFDAPLDSLAPSVATDVFLAPSVADLDACSAELTLLQQINQASDPALRDLLLQRLHALGEATRDAAGSLRTLENARGTGDADVQGRKKKARDVFEGKAPVDAISARETDDVLWTARAKRNTERYRLFQAHMDRLDPLY
jgi:hypothetical protein